MRIAEARLLFQNPVDGEILLAEILQKDRTWVFSHENFELSTQQEGAIRLCAIRRQKGEPVAYILGRREFYGRTFNVTKDVLVPRPATEGLVALALEWIDQPFDIIREIDTDIVAAGFALKDRQSRVVADVGTGSGCIALTLALERPDLRIIASDISSEALEIAKQNAKDLNATDNVEFLLGDALEPLKDMYKPFLIVSNPPYIPAEMELEKDVADFEPHQALFAGEKGMDVIEKLVTQAKNHPQCAGILLECRREQAIAVSKLLR